MTQIDTVLLKVSSRCNINCDYCYIYQMGDTGWMKMPKSMSQETINAIIDSLKSLAESQNKGFAVVLHGGEPLALGKEKLTLLLRGLCAALPAECKLSLQTNGTLLTKSVLDLCSETRTTVAVSLDGPKHIHDVHRLDANKEGTFERTIAGIQLLQAHPDKNLFAGILTVIDPETNPEEIYTFFKQLEVPSMDFLYRDGNHSSLPFKKAAFESLEYGQWLSRLWDLYIADPNPVPVSILDDITRSILGGYGSKEGMGTRVYGVVIIDTDGSITMNDTLKSSYDGADRFSSTWSIQSNSLFDVACTDEFHKYSLLQKPTCETCRNCSYLETCGGGMPLYRWREDNGYDNPSVYCHDHQFVINRIRSKVHNLLTCNAA